MITTTPPIIGLQALGSFFRNHWDQPEAPLLEGHQQTARVLATVVGELGYEQVSRQLSKVQDPKDVSAGTDQLIQFLKNGDERVAHAIAAVIQAEPELRDPNFLTQAHIDPGLQEQIIALFDSASERGAVTVFAAASVDDLAADLTHLLELDLLQLVFQRAEAANKGLPVLRQGEGIRGILNNLFGVMQAGVKSTADAVQLIAEDKGWPLPVLNGVVGDTLAAQNSPLAIKMELFGAVQARKICILVHGVCDSEATWQFVENPEDSYGSRLRQDFGYDPLYLRYNSGLHISTNGQLLAKQISALCNNAAEPIEEIIFIGHSMGGLVVRSACHYAQQAAAPWVKTVSKIFLLGTPHQGSDYEKLGNLTSTILRTIPNPVTWGISAVGNRRSAGIKDLRFGYLLDEDWKDQDADALWRNNSHPVSLLAGTDHYIIAATLAEDADNIFTQYFGDGVVQSRSARGQTLMPGQSIPFAPEHLKTIRGLSHVGLSRDNQVYQQIHSWMT